MDTLAHFENLVMLEVSHALKKRLCCLIDVMDEFNLTQGLTQRRFNYLLGLNKLLLIQNFRVPLEKLWESSQLVQLLPVYISEISILVDDFLVLNYIFELRLCEELVILDE